MDMSMPMGDMQGMKDMQGMQMPDMGNMHMSMSMQMSLSWATHDVYFFLGDWMIKSQAGMLCACLLLFTGSFALQIMQMPRIRKWLTSEHSLIDLNKG